MVNDLQKIKAHLREVILHAGNTLLQLRKKNYHIQYKSEGKYKRYPQIVSSLDQDIQQLIIEKITTTFPNHNIIAEEKPNTLNFNGYTWVIDPIDGTMQFVHNLPNFSVSIAVFEGMTPIAGAVYAPLYNDLYITDSKTNPYCNQTPIHVSSANELTQALVATSVYKSYMLNDSERAFHNIVENINNIRMFASTALDMCYVAEGKLDARILAYSEIWDHAAAALIVEQAGGKVTEWTGAPWTTDSRALVVSNSHIHDDLLALLNK